MLYSRSFVRTLRERPSDSSCESHALMLRAGLVRRVSNGLFAYLPPGLRALRRIELILREELARAGALEIKPPVMCPGELWRESGRWDAMGESMLRARNRLGEDLVVSPTAEELFVYLARLEISSYRDLPLNLYQINTKYRDEIRPRYGVMRAREFTMMDAYSFDLDEEGLDDVYRAMAEAYRRFFRRCGLSTIEVRADTGAMGGSASEEFMVASPVGDDSLLICAGCGYAANVEKASCALDRAPDRASDRGSPPGGAAAGPHLIATPGVRTIEELAAFLGIPAASIAKTLVYSVKGWAGGGRVAVCIRGDLDVNEAKLASDLGASEVALASAAETEEATGAPLGFAGPVGLSGIELIADPSVMALAEVAVGALRPDAHLVGVVPGRDFEPDRVADLRLAKAGDACPLCGAVLGERRGNELGHVFKLGTKYSERMGVRVLDAAGAERVPLMGCYGIGLDRTLASIIEERHDEDGIVWPASVAPYDISIVPLRFEGRAAADSLALQAELEADGLAVLLDDRDERPGVKFKDADLLGSTLRVVVGGRRWPAEFEVKARRSAEAVCLPSAGLADALRDMIREARAAGD